jgi:transcriptional regulator with XRE-family HTH domain
MPKDGRLGNKWRVRNRNIVGYRRRRPTVFVPGLKACRLAAALSERDLAEMVGTSHATINNLEVNDVMLERLCQALKVWPEDLTNDEAVENTAPQGGSEQRSASVVSDEERAERRREVNRIKGDFALRYSTSAISLGGLKARRLEAGLSQRELARVVGTNQTTIHQLEKRYGGRSAYAKTIRKLCQALGVRPADLICWDPVD